MCVRRRLNYSPYHPRAPMCDYNSLASPYWTVRKVCPSPSIHGALLFSRAILTLMAVPPGVSVGPVRCGHFSFRGSYTLYNVYYQRKGVLKLGLNELCSRTVLKSGPALLETGLPRLLDVCPMREGHNRASNEDVTEIPASPARGAC